MTMNDLEWISNRVTTKCVANTLLLTYAQARNRQSSGDRRNAVSYGAA